MIALIHGQIVEKSPLGVVIDANGVGYEVLVPTSVLSKMGDVGDVARLRTYLEVKEDAMALYGFLERAELEIFRLLLSVSGVGPRLAISILSGMTPQQILEAVARDDVSSFSRVKGIGKKIAAKVIFELRPKLTSLPPLSGTVGARPTGSWAEASEALRALGYKDAEIGEALNWVQKELATEDASDVSKVVRKALAFFQLPSTR